MKRESTMSTDPNTTTKSTKSSEPRTRQESAADSEARIKVKEKSRKIGVARRRLELLFDEGTLEEIGAEVLHRSHDFGLEKKQIPGDGVITACGMVDGRPVYAFAQDKTVLGGSLGEAHAHKICRLQDMALKTGSPFVAINDSGGARIQEGVNALGGYGEIFRRNVAASGVIPQISLIAGPCAGGAVYSPALTDFVGMVDGSSYMFLTGPKVIKTVTFEDITVEELGGGRTHSVGTGVSHFLWKTDKEMIEQTRRLLSYQIGRASCRERV